MGDSNSKLEKAAAVASKANEVISILLAHNPKVPDKAVAVTANHVHLMHSIIKDVPSAEDAAKLIEKGAKLEHISVLELTKQYSTQYKLDPALKVTAPGKEFKVQRLPVDELRTPLSNTSTSTSPNASPNDILAAMSVSASSIGQKPAGLKKELAFYS